MSLSYVSVVISSVVAVANIFIPPTKVARKSPKQIMELVSEASRIKCMDLCQRRRVNLCDAQEVFAQLYPGGEDRPV